MTSPTDPGSPDRRRRPTSTSNFGVGRRENHDASAFYDRFTPPEVSDDATLVAPTPVDEPFQKGDSRKMEALADGSVALVVTSPPYFAGKQYEEELERDGIPASYVEYLELLTDVFTECKRVLEPGGRIAVNIANLGRKPYRSLSADVIRILQDDLGLLLRGEVVWRKGVGDVGAAGNCAWGSFRKPSNPVLRDVTERVVIASKGRFDRAQSTRERERGGHPSKIAIDADEFMAATLDVWDLPAESAKRVQHPAPFPVALPERLTLLYTYENDLVLDPFMGSGSTLVAAARHRRRYVGYDLDPEYVDLARRRVEAVVETSPATDAGKPAAAMAAELIEAAGFTITHRNRKLRGTGLTVNYLATDSGDRPWYFDVSGAFTASRDGMLRTDTVWKSLGRASVLAKHNPDGAPLVFLTSDLPRPGSEGDVALRAAGPDAFFDAVALRDPDGVERLRTYAENGAAPGPVVGFWTERDLDRRT
jgi:DNA modification methylase